MSSEPLILTLLRVPVRLLNALICLVGSVLYLPSYLYFLTIHMLVFNPTLNSTLNKYIVSWLPRVLSLVVGFALFTVQFLYPMRYYWQKEKDGDWRLKAVGLLVSTLGFLFLMRKGYSKSLNYLKVPQLKSPMEHIRQLGLLVADTPSIVLTVVNLVLLSHSRQTLNFQYQPDQSKYSAHILGLVRASILYNFQKPACMYLRVFPWRLNDSVYFKKEKPYTLDRSVLIFFILTNTNADIVLFLFLGWVPFLSPWRSYRSYRLQLSKQPIAMLRSTIFGEAALTVIEYVQLLALGMCLPLNPRRTIRLFKQISKIKTSLNTSWEVKDGRKVWCKMQKKSFPTSLMLLLVSVSSVLTLLPRALVFLSVYKERKYQKIIHEKRGEINKKQLQTQQQSDYGLNYEALEISLLLSMQRAKLKLLIDLLLDLPFWAAAVLTVIIQPCSYRILWKLVGQEQDMLRSRALQSLLKAVVYYLTAGYLLLTLPLYLHMIRDIVSWYYNPTPQQAKLKTSKRVEGIAFRVIRQTIRDLRYLPLMYLLAVFRVSSRGQFDVRQVRFSYQQMTLQNQVIYHRTLALMRNRDLAELQVLDKQYLTSPSIRLAFWRAAHQIQKLRTGIHLAKIPIRLTRYLTSYYLKKVQQIRDRNQALKLSNTSRELLCHQQILTLAIKTNCHILLDLILLLVSLVLVIISLWRAPTLIYLYRSGKYKLLGTLGEPPSLTLFRGIIFVFSQQVLDLLMLPLYLLAALLCPLRVVNYARVHSFRFEQIDSNVSVCQYFVQKRVYFLKVILRTSFTNFLALLQLLLVAVTVFRIGYFKRVLRKEGLKLGDFLKSVLGVQKLPPLFYNQDNEWSRIQKTRRLISFTALQVVRDLLFLPVLLFVMCFPYRLYFVKQIFKKDDILQHGEYHKGLVSGRRKQLLKLSGRIIKYDSVCAVLNFVLIISVIRSKQGILLLSKNWRRNYTDRMLNYNYKKDLLRENWLLLCDLGVLFEFVLIFVSLVRLRQTIQRLKALRIRLLEQQKEQNYIQEINETTRKSQNRHNIALIGLYNFKSICQYLQPEDIYALSQTSQDIYLWSNNQELWQTLWQERYQPANPQCDQPTFRDKCIRTYTMNRPPRQPEITYREIITEEVHLSTRQSFNLLEFLNIRVVVLKWNQGQGFHQQVQRPDQVNFIMSYLFFKPISWLTVLLCPVLMRPNHRYIKQATVFLVCISSVVLYFCLCSTMITSMYYQPDKYMTFRMLSLIGIGSWAVMAFLRLKNMVHHSPALHPFDLFYASFRFVYVKMVKKLWIFLGNKSSDALQFIRTKLTIVYNEVILPLYRKVTQYIRSAQQLMYTVWVSMKGVMGSLIASMGYVVRSIKTVLTSLGKGYFTLLTTMMGFFLKMGRMGDLIFTLLALVYLFLPIILCKLFYWTSTTIIPAIILTLISSIKGFKVIQAYHRENHQ